MAWKGRRFAALATATATLLGGVLVPFRPVEAQPSAQTSPEDLARAKRLFRAGARAYDRGQFEAAAQAFEQAYELSPRIALRFSAGQARVRQYTTDREVENLRRAKEHFQAYVDEVKQGRRVKDAVEALGEIDLLIAKTEPTAPPPPEPSNGEGGAGGTAGEGGAGGGPAPATAPARKTTGTLQIDSDVEGATATVVGRPGVIEKLPVWLDVPPGTYEVIVRADGYEDARRTVRVQPRRLGLAFPSLKAIPANLTITGPTGAELMLDGRLAGRLPLSLSLDGGVHTVVAGEKGHENVSKTLVLQRGSSERIDIDLPFSDQRVAAHTFYGISGAAFAATIGAYSYARVVLAQAERLLSVTEGDGRRTLTRDELDEYQDQLSFAGVLGIAGVGSAATGVVSLAVGLLLQGFDRSNLEEAAVFAPSRPPDDDQDPDLDSTTVDLSAQVVPQMLQGQMQGMSFVLEGRF